MYIKNIYAPYTILRTTISQRMQRTSNLPLKEKQQIKMPYRSNANATLMLLMELTIAIVLLVP